MEILRKLGEEKLQFRIMDRRVTNRDFKYLKRLFLECLKENNDIVKQLNDNYKLIQVYFFYEQGDPKIEKVLKEFLKDSNVRHVADSSPAFTISRKSLGCIMFFVKHLKEFAEERKDIEDIEAYHKNGVFEELCHLIEQKGDSDIHPESYWALWRLYKTAGKQKFGNEIIFRLDTDRNHYEVYHMMIEAYPKEWIERYWRYFKKDPVAYEQEYEQWKGNFPVDIVLARLITDYLRTITVLFVAEKFPRQDLPSKHQKLLNSMVEKGKLDIEKKKNLIARDMGSVALDLVVSLDETIFKTSDAFFSSVIDLWKRLLLV